ncbi:sortilin isoform X2 [Ciona intestinalis]
MLGLKLSLIIITLLPSLAISTQKLVFEFEKSHSLNKRSLDEEDQTSSLHKRDATPSTCVPPADFVNKLTPGRTQHKFTQDTNPSISLTWSGSDGVILGLTTMTSMFVSQASKLYRSHDRGKTFEDISSRLDNGYIRKSGGMQVNPTDTNMVILFGYDPPFSTSQHTTIYTTNDAGLTFTKVLLPFKIDVSSIKFNAHNKHRLLAQSVSRGELWLSSDFGSSWKLVQSYVQTISWDPTDGDYFYFTYDPSQSMAKNSITNELYRENAFTEVSVRLAQDVHSFAVQDTFLFLSTQFQGKNGSRVMHVSKNHGDSWDAAQLPLINRKQFYSLLDMSEDMVFIHVDVQGDTGFGTIYTSDERGIIFSKSLLNHLYPNNKGITDFYKVLSLPGVYITSQLSEEKTVHSLITFDKGGTWNTLTAPAGSKCAATEKACNLQLHNYFSASKHVALPALPLSSKNTVGLIIAHGNIGDGLNFNPPKVYVSDDGGYSWSQPPQLDGPHYYGIGDRGGLLWAIPSQSTPTNIIKFSLDEGQCWHSFNFSDTPIQITGVSPEQGEKTTDLTIWGWDRNGDGMWMVVTVDFKAVMGSQCTRDDYMKWIAHETNTLASLNDNCLLGSKQSFIRRKKGSICTNSNALQAIPTHETCSCRNLDYLCDYGYTRSTDGRTCERDTSASNTNMDVCIEGTEEVILTKGYRKIPGDKCQGGFNPNHQVESLKKSCAKTEEVKDNFGVDKDLFVNYVKPHSNPHTGWIIFLVIVVLALGGALVYLVYKKRSLLMKVRYRPITQDEPDDSANTRLVGTATIMDDDEAVLVEMPNGGPPKNGAIISYHDDSDEDLLVT